MWGSIGVTDDDWFAFLLQQSVNVNGDALKFLSLSLYWKNQR
jgi:hypothetical protein